MKGGDMESSIFLARLFGIAYITMGIGMMFNLKTYQKVMEDFSKNAAVILYGGLMALFIGLLIILSHNVWVAGWPVLITLLGWGAVIKGIWLLVFPDTVTKFMKAYIKKAATLRIHAAVALLLGAVLAVLGYVVK